MTLQLISDKTETDRPTDCPLDRLLDVKKILPEAISKRLIGETRGIFVSKNRPDLFQARNHLGYTA